MFNGHDRKINPAAYYTLRDFLLGLADAEFAAIQMAWPPIYTIRRYSPSKSMTTWA